MSYRIKISLPDRVGDELDRLAATLSEAASTAILRPRTVVFEE